MEEPNWVLPYAMLEVGQSFFIPTNQPSKVIFTIRSMAIEDRINIRAYTTSKDGILGVRVWRI
jgi:hypothetical protein